jgi:hypothetical protein
VPTLRKDLLTELELTAIERRDHLRNLIRAGKRPAHEIDQRRHRNRVFDLAVEDYKRLTKGTEGDRV